MRKTIFTALVIGLIAMVSCKKDKETNEVYDPDPVPSPNYFPLAIGNYWVYDLFKVENHQETLTEKRDSLIITKDTVIRGEKYYVFEGVWFPQKEGKWYYRDSLGYIVNGKGHIMFTSEITDEVYFRHTLYSDSTNLDTAYHMEFWTNKEMEFVDLPIGEYEALSRTVDYIVLPGNENLSDSLKYRSYRSKFIEDIGQATDAVFYASAPFHFEKRLVKYHIENQEK